MTPAGRPLCESHRPLTQAARTRWHLLLLPRAGACSAVPLASGVVTPLGVSRIGVSGHALPPCPWTAGVPRWGRVQPQQGCRQCGIGCRAATARGAACTPGTHRSLLRCPHGPPHPACHELDLHSSRTHASTWAPAAAAAYLLDRPPTAGGCVCRPPPAAFPLQTVSTRLYTPTAPWPQATRPPAPTSPSP
jgi:hypothetical protein